MDKVDLLLCLLLTQNSRQSYKSLSDALGLSINAVYKRVQGLVDSGVIARFTSRINLTYYNGITVWMFGHVDTELEDAACERLITNDSIYWIAHGGGNLIYTGVYLKNIAQLDACSTFVKRECKSPDLVVGIMSNEGMPHIPSASLSDLDFRIIRSLHRDSRKPNADIAAEIGVSTKTVSNHLEQMEKTRLIQYSIEWYPDKSNDIVTFFHVQIQDQADKEKTGLYLMKKYPSSIMFFLSFVNLPNFLIIVAWSPTMKDINDLRKNLQEENFKSIVPNVVYTGRIYNTWRDTIIENYGK